MSKAQRDKGKRGENMAAHALRVVYRDAARDLNDVYNGQGVDLVNTGILAVQVKHHKNHVSVNTLKSVQPVDGRIPIVISWPTNRADKPAVILSLADFIKILAEVRPIC